MCGGSGGDGGGGGVRGGGDARAAGPPGCWGCWERRPVARAPAWSGAAACRGRGPLWPWRGASGCGCAAGGGAAAAGGSGGWGLGRPPVARGDCGTWLVAPRRPSIWSPPWVTAGTGPAPSGAPCCHLGGGSGAEGEDGGAASAAPAGSVDEGSLWGKGW